jgi:hypothetical protein
MRKVRPIRSSGLNTGGGCESTLTSSVGMLAGLDLSILDLSLRGQLGIQVSPPDMQARTLPLSEVAGRNNEW